ncbi:MAG: BON domain-containing protein [Spirochaeta sp.]
MATFGPFKTGAVKSHIALSQLDFRETDLNELQKHLQDALTEDPIITDPTNISVNLEKNDKKPHLVLIGKVHSEKEKQRAEEILSVNTGDKVTIANELSVEA